MANPKIATLVDPFNEGALNASLWNASTGGATSLDTVNCVVSVAVSTTSGTYNTLGASGPYDATSSSLFAQIVATPNGAGGASTILKIAQNTSNAIQAIVSSGGTFALQVITGGTTVSTALPAYNPDSHRWWRFTETGAAQFAFAVSQDGFNWSTLATVSYSWAATAVMVYFQTGASDTEPAGQVATIAHVNTMLGGPLNLNWPRLEEGWGAQWTCNGGDSPLDRYVNLTPRLRQQTSVSRGKQYELDQVRSSEASAVFENLDGVLDPTNTAGPYAAHIMPYQPWRRRMMWPPSRNALSQVMATGGDLGGYPLGTINSGENGPAIFTATDPAGGSFVATSSAWQGGTAMQFSVPSATAATTAVLVTYQPGVVPGNTYTHSIWVRNVTAATSLPVYAYMWWQTASGGASPTVAGSVSTLTGGGAWTQLTVTGTAPANAASFHLGVFTNATAAATCSIQADGWQLETAATASTWTCPGVWNFVLSGFTESWESDWDMGGTYGTIGATGVDALALISQVQLTDPLTQEINNNSPRFLYPLGDPVGSGSAADATGNYPGIYATTGKYGPGSLVFGTSITAATTAGLYTGGSGTVMTLNNPNPGTNLLVGATFLSLDTAGIDGPANAAVGWTRMLAFRYTAGSNPTSQAVMWSGFDQANGAGSVLHWVITSSGNFEVQMGGPGGGGLVYPISGVNVADSNWHLAIVSYSGPSTLLTVNLDGASTFWAAAISQAPVGLVSDNVGAFCDSAVGRGTVYNWKGDLSYCAEFPAALSGTVMTNIYEAWRSACAGESSDQRYARILRYSGYTGNTNLQPGLTTDMGPATDLAGTDGLSALQAVADTENGQHFVAADGTVTFQARSARYNALTPVYVFGENTAAGEIPYETCVMPLDPTHIGNIVQVTQTSTNQIFTAQDSTSQGDYFPRTLTRTVNAASAVECQAAAYYLLSRYKQPAQRISELTLHPSANPSIWPVCLALELGMRITVNRRPPFAQMISIPAFVENLAWSWDDAGEATLTLQCSPVDQTPYGLFASFHATLHTTISSGASTITINAGADNTNPAAAQLSAGQQLVLSEGLSTQETVTIKGVATTTSGWTTCVITLVSNTTNGHASGDTVCEPLPTGITNPATWDATSQFGSACFSY